MRRVHVPELEDEPWFPRSLRDALTAFLHVSAEKLELFEPALDILGDVLDRHLTAGGAPRIVDLCSGGGGPLLSILEQLRRRSPEVEAILTDLYPNERAFDEAEARLGAGLRGHRAPVDATDVPADLDGVRTIFNALHHFRPDGARKILADAARKGQPFCAFEVVERHPLSLAVIAGVPLAVLALIPLTRPDPLRLALTYALPVIPLATGWDGLASCMRAYSPAELEELAREAANDRYRFTVGQARRGSPIPMRVTWLVGEPV
jgi:hypothetical protein